MGKRGTFFFGLLYGVLAQGGHAQAQGSASSRNPASFAAAGTAAPFALADLARRDARDGRLERSERVTLPEPPETATDKLSLRWQDVPLEGGPRFEIGALGGSKGAGRRKLLHIGMDWSF
ncbi:hypothetical protein HT136_12110 [Novosphingobium profundi]|uniref:hypothetical protein n=1 Tax=Novosphingobium profundi TaxID=1774954 RepID=UPI001BDB129A|nr:hypothetical protein [Novosphingobium profundi]MBT0669105.1 hypothetical protein [Novosphingobium profundi]